MYCSVVSNVPPSSFCVYHTGIRETVYDAMMDAYAHLGQPPPPEVKPEAGILEMLFEALSKHLSVLETMALMWGKIDTYMYTSIHLVMVLCVLLGVEEPMKKIQPSLYQFICHRLLNNEEPTAERKKEAVTKLLSPFIPSVASTMVHTHTLSLSLIPIPPPNR